jgi:hypothetical protein
MLLSRWTCKVQEGSEGYDIRTNVNPSGGHSGELCCAVNVQLRMSLPKLSHLVCRNTNVISVEQHFTKLLSLTEGRRLRYA